MASYDLVGNLIILNKKISKKQALTLLKTNKQVKTVLYKSKQYSGKYRLPKLTYLAGLKTKETIHKESNVLVKVNPEKAYFSVRSSNERLRISKLVKKNEIILVMFSGIGIYPLVLSKNSKAKEVYGIEINSSAFKLAQENVKLNKINNIQLLKGDVRKVTPKIKFDRVIMPHPSDSEKYLPLALKHLKPKGTIHLYVFAHENDFNMIKQKYKRLFKKVSLVKAGSPAPGKFRICLDLLS